MQLQKEENFAYWHLYGLKNPSDIKCYELTNSPGLFIVPNPFCNGFQRYFVKKCLRDYHNLPNKTNLDAHMTRDGMNIWQNAIRFVYLLYYNKHFDF
jgi:hypothetical protein